MLEIMWLFFIFIFGLIVGSFLNVLIDRLPQGENPFAGRSHCDHCGRTLHAKDLIPIVSFLFLKGKCRFCSKKLSWQYPAIELATGFLFVLLFQFGIMNTEFGILNIKDHLPLFIIQYSAFLLIFSSFLVILVTDFKYQIIPDLMVITAGFGTLVYHLSLRGFSHILIYENVVPAVIAGLFFFLIYYFTKGRGMGFGDVKLAGILGLFLGFPKIIVGLYVAFLTGAGLSLILILARKKGLKSKIAFGPFLIFGAVIAFFWAERILRVFFSSFF